MPAPHYRPARDAVAPEDPEPTTEATSGEGRAIARMVAELRKRGASDAEIVDALMGAGAMAAEPPLAAAMDARHGDFMRRFPHAARVGTGLPTALPPQRRPAPHFAADAATLDRRAARFPHSDRLGR